MTMCKRTTRCFLTVLVTLLILTGCVDQHPGGNKQVNDEQSSDQEEAVRIARKKVDALGREVRIAATSPAVAQICDRLDLNLVGVCSSDSSEIPERYRNLPSIGTAMSPDMEILASLSPDWILSPVSLKSDLESKYETLGCDWAFLNLRSVSGMYESIRELGILFGREAQAEQLQKEYQNFYEDFQKEIAGKEHPKVLILMGLPGSYVIATEKSYIGSLVAMAGAENVYQDQTQEFLNVNTEDMKTKEPDIILRAAHALPDQVEEMFEEDFKTNDIWKHFRAVKNQKVYDLPYEQFGMSATFAYQDALNTLKKLLYEE